MLIVELSNFFFVFHIKYPRKIQEKMKHNFCVNCKISQAFASGDQRSSTKEAGETGRGRGGHGDMQTLTHSTHTHKHRAITPSDPSDVACSISVRRRQTRANGHTVETGHDGVLTAVPRIVIGTPDGGKTRQRGEG